MTIRKSSPKEFQERIEEFRHELGGTLEEWETGDSDGAFAILDLGERSLVACVMSPFLLGRYLAVMFEEHPELEQCLHLAQMERKLHKVIESDLGDNAETKELIEKIKSQLKNGE